MHDAASLARREPRSFVPAQRTRIPGGSASLASPCRFVREEISTASLLDRVIKRLSDTGNIIVSLNLAALRDDATLEQWYFAMLEQIGEQLPFDRELKEFWMAKRRLSPLQRFFGAIHDVLLLKFCDPLVVFVKKSRVCAQSSVLADS